jgi:hypothetical protein
MESGDVALMNVFKWNEVRQNVLEERLVLGW